MPDTCIINQYAQVYFDSVKIISDFRQYGNVANNGTGRWTIQILNPISDQWEDWVTDVAVYGTTAWEGSWTSATKVWAAGIKIICTTVDTGSPGSYIGEFEVKY